MNKKQSKLKIIFVAPVSDNAGGIAVWLKNILIYCKKNQICSFIIDTMPRKGKSTKRNIFDRFVLSPFRVFKQKKELVKILQNNPDAILHIATSGSLGFYRDFVLLKTAHKLGAKTIMHYHFGRMNEVIDKKKGFEYNFFTKCLKYSDIHIAIDKSTFITLKKLNLNVHFINNPVQPHIYTYNTKNDFFIFVGRSSALKGFYELIDAFDNFKDKLILVGKIDKNEVSYLKNKNNICVKGELPHSETLDIISESKCLILPSHTEGMPNVILEAMSYGVPCIGTNVGSIEQMIGESGIVIKPKNTNALCDAIRKMNDDDFRLKCSQKAYDIINKEYSLDIVGSKLLSIWSK